MKTKIKISEVVTRESGFNRTPIDLVTISGRFHAVLRGPDGKVKGEWRGENIITNVGRQHIIDRLQAAAVAVADYMAIGSGTTAAAAADTALETELARAQGTLSQPDAYTDRLSHTFAAGTGTGTIGEVGRLNAAAAGTLVGRSVYTSWTPAATIPKGAGDSLAFTYDFTYAAG